MVELRTSQLAPTARPADPVSTARSEGLASLSRASQVAANTFTNFYEAEAANQRELIVAQMQADWSKRYAETARAAGNGYAQQITQEFDTYRSEVLATAPQRGRDDLETTMEKYRIDLEAKATEAEIAARARRAAAAASDAQRLRLNALVSDPGLLEQYMEQFPQHADEFVRTANAARMMDTPIIVADEVRQGMWDAYYTPSQKLSILEAGQAASDRMARDAAAALGVQRDEFSAAINEEADFIAANGYSPVNGLYSNPDALADTVGTLYNPGEAEQVTASALGALSRAQAIYDAAVAPAADVDAEVARLLAAVQEPGSTREDLANLNAYASAVQARQASITTDAAGHAMRSNDEVSALFNAMATAETPEDAAQAARMFGAALNAEYDRLGVADEFRRAMPASYAAQVVESVRAQPDVAAQSLAALMDQWQDPRIMGELAAAGMPPAYVSAMRHADNSGLAAAIVGLAEVPVADLTNGLVAADVADMRAELVGGLTEHREAFERGDPTGQATAAFNREYEMAEKLALQMMRTGTSAATAAEMVVEQMFPETAVNQSDAHFLLPAQFEENTVMFNADLAKSEEALRAFNPVPLDNPAFTEFQDSEVMIAAAQNGVWLANSTGDGIVLTLDLGGYYLPITNAAGRFYEHKFTDLVTRRDTHNWQTTVDPLTTPGNGVGANP